MLGNRDGENEVFSDAVKREEAAHENEVSHFGMPPLDQFEPATLRIMTTQACRRNNTSQSIDSSAYQSSQNQVSPRSSGQNYEGGELMHDSDGCMTGRNLLTTHNNHDTSR